MKKLVLILSIGLIYLLFFFGKESTLTPYIFPKPYMFPKMPASETNFVTIEGSKLGRFLFYDPILSKDSSIACGNCHKQEYAFSDSPKKFSSGINGSLLKRNTIALFNLAWSPTLFWDGRVETIEEQIFHPVRTVEEMNMNWTSVESRINKSKFYKQKFKQAFGNTKIDSVLISKAIAQFLRTLISYQSKYDRFLQGKERLNIDEMNGFVLMNNQTKGDCLHCHTTDGGALGTTYQFSNNGLDSIFNPASFKDKGRGAITKNEKDFGKFKIPSLRNIALTSPYMHDGRFNTLEEVVEFYSTGVKLSKNIDSKMEFAHKGGAHLSEIEKKDIVAFLKTMTDSVFITNKEFSNPFVN